jgi:hypothetical protein
MFKCVACHAPLMTAEVSNTDISVRVICSCGTRLQLVRGIIGLDRSYRHPDFITGDDVCRHHALRIGLRELEADVKELTELKVAMTTERDRLWKTVQHKLVNKHEAKVATETLGQKTVADKLASMFTPEQLQAMMESLK